MKWVLVDKKTGEVVAQNVIVIGKQEEVKKQPLVAFSYHLVMYAQTLGPAGRLFLYIMQKVNPTDMSVYLSPKEVCQELNINTKTYYNWLNTLIKKGHLAKIGTNLYRLNTKEVSDESCSPFPT